MDINELAGRLAERLDMDRDAARELADGYLSQIGGVDGRQVDRLDISEADAASVFEAADVGESIDPQPVELGEIEDLTASIADLTGRIGDIAERRNGLIAHAYRHGVSVPRLVESSGLNRSRIYAILKGAR